jgi:hypothetical protein
MPQSSPGPPTLPLVILEFIGGAWDGMNLSTRSSDPLEAELAAYVLKTTGGGAMGGAVIMPHQYAIRNTGGCSYVVSVHTQVENDCLVRLECRGEDRREIFAAEKRTIVLRFDRGCQDGRIVRSDSADVREALLAVACYHLTGQGRSACEILRVPPMFCRRCQPRTHCKGYRPAERIESDRVVTVTLEFSEDVEPRV